MTNDFLHPPSGRFQAFDQSRLYRPLMIRMFIEQLLIALYELVVIFAFAVNRAFYNTLLD